MRHTHKIVKDGKVVHYGFYGDCMELNRQVYHGEVLTIKY